ncbi:hypothetical protein SUGI_0485470 [Cryptomeria japonica]|nr:hypothetical protein SUGI_0485470 [Cryptomeria japonica]
MEFCKEVLQVLFLCSLCYLAWGKTSKSDIESLILFKNVVEESSIFPSTCLSSWNFSIDPCDSVGTSQFICGIRCDVKVKGRKRITSLTLDQPGYRGSLDPSIGNLRQLTELYLAGNAFHGIIPQSIGRLTKLNKLDLSGNMFSGSLPHSLGKLKSLQVLSLSNNRLSGSLPHSLNSLENLITLDLSYNMLSGMIPPMGGLRELESFDLSSNRLVGAIPSDLPVSLSQMLLRSNFLTGQLPSSLSRLQNLGVLDISCNRLSGKIDGFLLSNPELQQLNLSNNSFTAISVQNLSAMDSQLVAVDIGFNKISGLLPSNIVTLQSLASLSLRYNRFYGPIPADYGVKVAAEVHPLVRLYLDGNYLSGEVPPQFLNINENISGSFANNCLKSCPSNVLLCQEAQRPASEFDSQLVALDIGFNKISGVLPSNIVTLQSLASLSLSYNRFYGPIPADYGARAAADVHPLVRLYLDGNYLNGEIPSQFLNISSENISGSFANNCLKSCPSSVLLCQGTQRPASECRNA